MVYEITVPDATHAWTAEDGGRIRRTVNSGLDWTFDVTPLAAEHILRGIYVLPDLSQGWAVGDDGTMLHNPDMSLDIWNKMTFDPLQVPEDAEFFDVFFEDAFTGWILAEHGMWITTDGGGSWTETTFLDAGGSPLSQTDLNNLDLYAMDFRLGLSECLHLCDCPGGLMCFCPLTPTFGLACAEPGFIYRTLDGITWREVFDLGDLSCQSPTSVLGPCADGQLAICGTGGEFEFEPWDIEISDHPSSPLAIMVGGVGKSCGLIFASDDWGCTWTREMHDCEVNPGTCVGFDPNLAADPGRPLNSFRTLYGLACDPTNMIIIGNGYNGEHVLRVPGPPGTTWEDYSQFGNVWKLPYNGAVIFPLFGAEFAPDGSVAYITGMGGHIRTTTDGMTYTEEGSKPGDFRVRDAGFVSDTDGTVAGQFSLLAETIDGGELWVPRNSVLFSPTLTAVAFETNLGLRGVAVGQRSGGVAMIKYTFNGGTDWFDATVPSAADEHLNAVAWDRDPNSDTRFWAVGNGGLILETLDGGGTWAIIPSPAGDNFHIQSVAFASPLGVAVVGKAGTPPATVGTAFTYIAGNWTDVSPTQTPGMLVLSGVDAKGSVVYAVGTQKVGGIDTGIVLKLGTDFEKLGGGAPDIPLCTVGEAADNYEPLNAVKLLSTGPNDHLLIAGQCGVFWEFAGGTWTQHRSETSSHVRGIRVAPGSDRVYLIANRKADTQSCIVREKW